jgi:hypothetical protein
MILAAARTVEHPLLTSDQVIAASALVAVIWD